MGRTFAARSRIAALLATAGMLVVATAVPATAAPPGGAPEQKTFTVDVHGTTGAGPDGRDTFAGDANATIDLTLTNTSPTQQLGSADITVPSVFARAAGQLIQLRNLALPPVTNGVASFVKLTLTVDVQSCVELNPAPLFTVKVKQSNDFKGTGNDFSKDTRPGFPSDLQVNVVGNCKLAFVNQPTDADRDANITSVAFDPNGAKVTVQVLDAGNTGRATSSAASIKLIAVNANVPAPIAVGNATATASNGLATFSPGPTIGVSSSGYTFNATSTFTASLTPVYSFGPSSSFAIVDGHALCTAGDANACHKEVNSPDNKQTANATFGSGGTTTNLTVSLGAADAAGLFTCTGYAPRSAFVAQFAFTGDAGGDRVGTFSITVPNATEPLNTYEVCWASTVDFTTKSGLLASAEADFGDGAAKPGAPDETIHVGLLPDCPKRVDPVPLTQLPCVSNRFFTKQGKIYTAHLEVKTTGADPWAY